MEKYTLEMTNETPRRSFIKATGIAISGGALTAAAGSAGATSGWVERSTPTSTQLSAVSYALDGAYAVGHGGYVLEREGGTWTTVTDDGPSGNGNDLSGSDATDDGQRLWVVGASGEIGEYDVASESFLGVVSIGDDSDLSGPDDYTDNLRDVAVTGLAGDANVYVTDDSGYVTYSFDNGETWSYTTPGSGSTIPAIGMHSDTDGHCSDTNQSVFADDGENWSKIGVDDRDENFYGLDSNADDNVWVCGNEGLVLEYDGSWSADSLGNVTLRDIQVTADRTSGLTVGSGGRVFRRSGDWVEANTPTEENLKGVVRGDPDALDFDPAVDDTPDVAVGASGTVIEHA